MVQNIQGLGDHGSLHGTLQVHRVGKQHSLANGTLNSIHEEAKAPHKTREPRRDKRSLNDLKQKVFF